MVFMQIVRTSRKGILRTGANVIQVATLTGRGTRGGPLVLPKPFPYRTKYFTMFNTLFDNTMLRVSQENAKIIVVEGPIAVGKSAFCKYLAEEFDMYYMPQVTMDEFYILPNGYDLRKHDHELPKELRSYDHKNFCVDPFHRNNGFFQYNLMQLKFYQYMNALQHIMNTGQGVVLERSTYSDLVYIEAMAENKFLTPQVRDAFLEIKKNTSTFFMAPHLIIYLDIPVPVVQERIRTRNYSYEQNSPALTTEFLTSIEKFFKQHYLKNAVKASDVLIYDWTDGGDLDVVIDDIEKLDLDIMRSDNKFTQWWLRRREWNNLRIRFSTRQNEFSSFFYYPFHNIPSMFIPGEVLIEWIYLLRRDWCFINHSSCRDTDFAYQRNFRPLHNNNGNTFSFHHNKLIFYTPGGTSLGLVNVPVPECRFESGFNYHAGDSIFSILFKSQSDDTLSSRHYYSPPTITV